MVVEAAELPGAPTAAPFLEVTWTDSSSIDWFAGCAAEACGCAKAAP